MLLFSHRKFLDGVKAAGNVSVSITQLKTLATAQGNDHIVSFLDKASLKEQVEVKAYLKQAAPKAKKNIPSKLPYAQVGERDFQGMTEVSIYVNDDRVKSIKTDDVDGLVEGYKIDYPSAGVEYADGILTITPADKTQEANIYYDIAGIIIEVTPKDVGMKGDPSFAPKTDPFSYLKNFKHKSSKKKAALIFGEERKAIAEDKGNAFGLEGKDRTLASEDQKKIYTPKKVAPTTEDEQRYNFRNRQKIEVWNPTTSDIKAAVGAIAEALKAKPDFPEILGRAEKDPVAKRDEKSAKEKSSSKKTASLGEQLDGAKLVKYDPNNQLIFAWFGGTGVNIYDETGYEVDYFSFPEQSKNPESVAQMIAEKMAEISKTGAKKTAERDSWKARYMQQNAQFSAGGSTHLESELKKYFEGTPITVEWKAGNLLELNLNGVKEEDFANNAGGKGIEGFNGIVMQFNGDYDYPENGKVRVYPNWRRSMGSKKEAKLSDADLLKEILDKYNQHRKIWMDNHKGSDAGYDEWFTRQVQGVGTKFSAKELDSVLSTEWLRIQNEKEKREDEAKKKTKEPAPALAAKDVKADSPAAVPAAAPEPAAAAPAAEPASAPAQAAKKTAENIDIQLGIPLTVKDPSGMERREIPTSVDPNSKTVTMVPEGTETTTIQQK